MATPRRSTHALPGALGAMAVDVVSGDRRGARPALVLLHGFKGFKDWGMFPPVAERLARAGFSVAVPNLSGCGADAAGAFTLPDRFRRNTFGAELHDLLRVVAALGDGALELAPPSAIGIIGHSRGGGVAVLAAAVEPRVRALVTWAGIATIQRWDDATRRAWRARGQLDVVNTRTGQVLPIGLELLDELEGPAARALDIEAAAARVPCPWLLLHGTADAAVPVAEARRLAAAARGPHELIELEGAGHTFGAVHPFAGWTPDLTRVTEETIRWASAHLT